MSSGIFKVKINDGTYENFTEARLFRSLDMGCGEFLFSASNSQKQTFPFGKGAKAEVLIDSNKMLTGYINSVGGSYDATSHELNFAGRCKTQDLIDSSINWSKPGALNIKGKMTLVDLIKKVLKLNGITDINVLTSETIKPFSVNERVEAEQDENAFKFIEKYCQKRQVLFTTNENGDIVLTRAGTRKYLTILQCSVTEKENNILQASFQDSDQERYNTYLVFTQGNLLSGIDDDVIEIKKGKPAVDKNIRATRIIRINSSLTSDIQTSTDRAIWESNIRRVRAFQYNCRIRGYYLDKDNTVLVKPNNIITVNDELLGIKEDLLIKSCRYIKSLRNGSYTDLELVNKDAYTLKAQQDEVASKFNKGNAIVSGVGA